MSLEGNIRGAQVVSGVTSYFPYFPTKLIGHKLFDSMNMKTVSHESRTECFCKLSIDFSFTVIQDSHIYVSQKRSNTEKYFEFNPTVQS